VKNKELAEKLNRVAEYLEMGDVDYKPFAYRRAASSILELEESVEEIYDKEGRKGLEEISGVGKNIADKLEEYILTGEIEHLKTLREKFPVDLKNMLRVEGLGPKSVKKLYENLGVENLEDLKIAASEGRVAEVEGLGEKTEKNILEAIEFLKKDEGKWALGEVLPVAREIYKRLKSLKEVKRISFAGSLRRKKELVGDVDLLVSASKTEKIMKSFTSFPNVEKVLGEGETKSSIRLREGFDADLRIVGEKSFGSALQYFTGSKNHNIKIRKIAKSKGLKLNEYGLFDKKKKIAGRTEKEVYSKLGLTLIPPELREDRGEVEKAQKGEDFSDLCKLEDLKGDLHIHTDWTGGANSLKEMVSAARERGYAWVGIADHTEFLRIENGLSEKELSKQRKEIEKLNSKFEAQNSDFYVMQGCEANILRDGSLDISDKGLKKLDYVIAGMHSGFKMGRIEMTERLIKAMRHPEVDIISHPTGRLIKKRDSLNLDMEKIFKVAEEENVFLEINSSPARLDLKDADIKKCVERGIKLAINSDSHHLNQLENVEFGVGQARRGWAKSTDIINTLSKEDFLSLINN